MKVKDLVALLIKEDQELEVTKSHFSSSYLGGQIAAPVDRPHTSYVIYSPSESAAKLIVEDDIDAGDVTREVLVI